MREGNDCEQPFPSTRWHTGFQNSLKRTLRLFVAGITVGSCCRLRNRTTWGRCRTAGCGGCTSSSRSRCSTGGRLRIAANRGTDGAADRVGNLTADDAWYTASLGELHCSRDATLTGHHPGLADFAADRVGNLASAAFTNHGASPVGNLLGAALLHHMADRVGNQGGAALGRQGAGEERARRVQVSRTIVETV